MDNNKKAKMDASVTEDAPVVNDIITSTGVLLTDGVPQHRYVMDGHIYKCLESNDALAIAQAEGGVTVYYVNTTRTDKDTDAKIAVRRYFVLEDEYREDLKIKRTKESVESIKARESARISKEQTDAIEALKAQGLSSDDIVSQLLARLQGVPLVTDKK